MANTPILFKKCQINGVQASCRIMRSATFEALGTPDGLPTKALEKLFVKLAKGKCGLIVSGCTYTEAEGRAHLKQVGFVTQSQIDSFARLTKAVHASRGILALQFNHAGSARYPHEPVSSHNAPIAPSATKVSREATLADIDRIVESFTRASRIAYEIGVNAVQIHAAHTYLIGQFLSPLTNHRTDGFGGNTEKRFELLRRILVSIRHAVPKSYPVFLKMNGSDREPGGVTIKDAIQTAKLAEKAGADALEISCGGVSTKPWSCLGNVDLTVYDPETRKIMEKNLKDFHFEPTFNEKWAAEIKKNVQIPVISVGGYRSFSEMNSAITSGKCDMVSLSRPFIREPGIVAAIMKDKTHASTCASCNRCLLNTSKQENPLRCLFPY